VVFIPIFNFFKNTFNSIRLQPGWRQLQVVILSQFNHHTNYFTIFFRSPWTNAYDPPLEDGVVPSDRLRKLEIEVNAAFEAYRDM
jgi:hypothetical protein